MDNVYFLPFFFFLFLTGDESVDLFAATDVASIVVVGLTIAVVVVVVASVIVVAAASTVFTDGVLFLGDWGFFPFRTTWVHPSFLLRWSPGSVFFCQILSLLLL